MNIRLITPAARGSRHGNRVTAHRWARILRSLGHRVVIAQEYDRAKCDLLIALHARRSAPSVARFRRLHPDLPLIVALTGTDLYKDIRRSRSAQRSLELADLLVTLQPLGNNELPRELQGKARAILQSATPTPMQARGPTNSLSSNSAFFDVCVVGHLRPVKDPFRTAQAARLLSNSSHIRVLHVGGAMSPEMEVRARAEVEQNPRYRWLGNRPHWQTRRIMARSRALVLTSRLEGGANVVSEALADSVPVISSRIPGSVGILGEDYPGYFTLGNTRDLARLLRRVESDPPFLKGLKEWCAALSPSVRPECEQAEWEALLRELAQER